MSQYSYAHQNLRSRSFKGQNLQGVSFQGGHCGVSYFGGISKLVGVSFLAGVLGGMLMLVGAIFNISLASMIIRKMSISSPEITWIVVSFGILISLVYCGVIKLFFYENVVFALIILLVGAIASALTIAKTPMEVEMAAVAGVAVGAIAGTGALIIAIVGEAAVAVVIIVTIAVAIVIVAADHVRMIEESAMVFTLMCIYLSFSIILFWRAIWKEDPQLAFIRNFALSYHSWLGTNFTGADLTEADFTHAQLENTRFTNTKLIRTNFYQAKNLKFAYLKNTILANCAVRELLVTGNGEQKSYAGLDLTGAYLQNANLQHADLSRAILLNADLRGANLTGATIENWLIDTTTSLENIQCDYIFLENNKRKREPPEGNFKTGEFTKLFQQVVKTLEFLVEHRTELEALLRAAQQVREQGIDLEFGSIENKQGSAKVTFIAPPESERETLYTEMKREFEIQKSLLAEYQGRLLEKESQIGKLEGLLTIFRNPTGHIKNEDNSAD